MTKLEELEKQIAKIEKQKKQLLEQKKKAVNAEKYAEKKRIKAVETRAKIIVGALYLGSGAVTQEKILNSEKLRESDKKTMLEYFEIQAQKKN